MPPKGKGGLASTGTATASRHTASSARAIFMPGTLLRLTFRGASWPMLRAGGSPMRHIVAATLLILTGCAAQGLPFSTVLAVVAAAPALAVATPPST